MRVRAIVLSCLVASVGGVFVGGAIADERASNEAPPVLTAEDCPEATSLYTTVGQNISTFGEACPDREAVLTDIANNHPIPGTAALCEKALSDGRVVETCTEYLSNRDAYVKGVAELQAQGIELDQYREEK